MTYEITDELIARAQSEMAWHPASMIFQPMGNDAFDELCKSVKSGGVWLPIVTFGGTIVDGRNRQMACIATGQQPVLEALPEDTSPESLAEMVWSVNAARRHLTASQKSIAAAEMKLHTKGLTTKQAAKISGASERNTRRAKNVLENGSPELVKACETGHVAVEDAEKILGMPQEEQDRRAKLVVSGKATTVSRVPDQPQGADAEAWLAAAAEPYERNLKILRKMIAELEGIAEDEKLGQHFPGTKVKLALSNAQSMIAAAIPYRYTGGDDPPEGSPCGGAGFVTRFQYDQPAIRQLIRDLGFEG